MKYIIRIGLTLFLIMALFLAVSPAVHAGGGEENTEDVAGDTGDPGNPGGDDPPGLDVDIGIVGDNPDVDIGIEGNNAEVNVGVSGDNSEVYINGQNLNEPTVIHQATVINQEGGGVDSSWVKKKINEVLNPIYLWMEESGAKLGLTMDGLAKMILLIGEPNPPSTIADTLNDHTSRLNNSDAEILRLKDGQESLFVWSEEFTQWVEIEQTSNRERDVELENYIKAVEQNHNRELLETQRFFFLIIGGVTILFGVLCGITFRKLRKRRV